jgi:hypothetical protein
MVTQNNSWKTAVEKDEEVAHNEVQSIKVTQARVNKTDDGKQQESNEQVTTH